MISKRSPARPGSPWAVWRPLRGFLDRPLRGTAKPRDHIGRSGRDHLGRALTVPLLIEHMHRVGGLCLSEDTIRRQLHRMGYRYKRPRYVLVPDPLYEKKARNPAASASSPA